MLSKFYYQSPLGEMVGLLRGDALVGLWFAEQKYYGGKFNLTDISTETSETTKKTMLWLDAYFNGDCVDSQTLSLSPEGTPYQKRVWQVLSQVPYGVKTTYKAIAEELNRLYPDKPTSPRAVGGAVGHNPISIIIPCHRVVAVNQALTGYAGGLDRKVALLEIEGR
ncbi:methylated-DNA--[protein]-cysteine S-methyltransferase [Vagococcus silagei]|uniref:methylated-DNA--[protein]-cysteine S-methyltransferase n=1 Tax=Vagococcus silagei TaxID=2508885 RepID=A0A4V3TV21_9ENTE|nr:methylated-DNA--[protein]-cysteine S-methyltransferase [Vagococcus silagei]THB61139.1 methylated-DNA--[protein]-cysteine S-methyltransferase [Vagococcus silagei]